MASENAVDRPIGDFWSLLKAKVYENNWEAKTLHQWIKFQNWKHLGVWKKDLMTFACLILLKIKN